MNFKFSLKVAFLLVSAVSQGQSYFYNSRYYEPKTLWEAGLSIGAMNCLTDLGGRKGPGKPFLKDLTLGTTKTCGGLYLSAIRNQIAGLRLEFTFGRVAACDSILKSTISEAKNRRDRNLHFQSDIVELSFQLEFYPFGLLNKEPAFMPYLLLGSGVFSFDPKAKFEGKWVHLNSLHTEGQGFIEVPGNIKYKLIQLNFQAGLGIKYDFNALVCGRIEIIHRILRTDYLDDVSNQYIDPALFYRHLDRQQANMAERLADRRRKSPGSFEDLGNRRGNPDNNDSYFSLNMKVAVTLNRTSR